jgi:hypothetical protein
VNLASPIFWNVFPERKYGLNYTLANGAGKQGKTGSPARIQEARTRFSGKQFQKFGCSLPDLRISDVPAARR